MNFALPPAKGFDDSKLEEVPSDKWQYFIANATFCGVTKRKPKDGLKCHVVQGKVKGHTAYFFFEYPSDSEFRLFPGSQYLVGIIWDAIHIA